MTTIGVYNDYWSFTYTLSVEKLVYDDCHGTTTALSQWQGYWKKMRQPPLLEKNWKIWKIVNNNAAHANKNDSEKQINTKTAKLFPNWNTNIKLLLHYWLYTVADMTTHD